MRKVIIALLAGICVLTSGKLKAQPDCNWEWGDFDCNGAAWELTDVVVIITNYRGLSPPCFFCDCGDYGENFPVSADVDGNCIPYELSDLVAALSAYGGGVIPEVLCPGCYHLTIEKLKPDPPR